MSLCEVDCLSIPSPQLSIAISPKCKCVMRWWQHAKGMWQLFTHQTQTVHKATSSICMSKRALCLTDSASVIAWQYGNLFPMQTKILKFDDMAHVFTCKEFVILIVKKKNVSLLMHAVVKCVFMLPVRAIVTSIEPQCFNIFWIRTLSHHLNQNISLANISYSHNCLGKKESKKYLLIFFCCGQFQWYIYIFK